MPLFIGGLADSLPGCIRTRITITTRAQCRPRHVSAALPDGSDSLSHTARWTGWARLSGILDVFWDDVGVGKGERD